MEKENNFVGSFWCNYKQNVFEKANLWNISAVFQDFQVNINVALTRNHPLSVSCVRTVHVGGGCTGPTQWTFVKLCSCSQTEWTLFTLV